MNKIAIDAAMHVLIRWPLFQVMFQYAARHSPLRIEHLLASVDSCIQDESTSDADMLG